MMPRTRTVPAAMGKAAPISWPSLTDLAASLYGRARGLDTLGREVRRLRVRTRKIGRELRVEPRGAVRVLEARGLTIERATALVMRVVEMRTQEVPGITEQDREAAAPRIQAAQRYGDPIVRSAAERYEELHQPTFVLPQGQATFSTAELTRAITGGQP
jgi:hypothetical protein